MRVTNKVIQNHTLTNINNNKVLQFNRNKISYGICIFNGKLEASGRGSRGAACVI